MKIGIVTLNGYFNFGNRLQNYALQKTIEKLGFEVETVWHTNIKKVIKTTIKILLPFNNINKKTRKLFLFSKKYINTKYTFDVKKVSKNYDYFVCGSDQVWNHNFKTFSDEMFLTFSNKNKNIAYAASFGINNINEKYKTKYKKGLNNFKAISVREDEGKKIILDIDTLINPTVVLDPTLLLSKKEWETIANTSKIKVPDRYILVYMLGNINEKKQNQIFKIANENNCEIINIMDKKSKYYSCSPEDFLYLEKNAYLICTDSFHSTVFSIIFETPFLVFDREDKYEKMNSRINTLLQKTELQNQLITNNQINIKKINFKKSKELLKKEIEKSIEFLKQEIR